jgi:hypothetical protein
MLDCSMLTEHLLVMDVDTKVSSTTSQELEWESLKGEQIVIETRIRGDRGMWVKPRT